MDRIGIKHDEKDITLVKKFTSFVDYVCILALGNNFPLMYCQSIKFCQTDVRKTRNNPICMKCGFQSTVKINNQIREKLTEALLMEYGN